jgi:hypothetical protein
MYLLIYQGLQNKLDLLLDSTIVQTVCFSFNNLLLTKMNFDRIMFGDIT